MLKKAIITSLITLIFCSNANAIIFKSKTIRDGKSLSKEQEYKGFGCDGENISPDLRWSNFPKNTKSLALTVFDPDAPTESGWWHWVVFNIPTSIKSVPKNIHKNTNHIWHKTTTTVRNDYGNNSFDGACPPEGDSRHRYIFTIHALDVEEIDLNSNASPAAASYFINKHTIKKETITATYKRK